MSQFHVYVNSEFNYDEDTSKKFPPGNYCICCLDRNVPYINLGTCKHTGFFDYISKYKIEFSEMLICYSCHYMLKRIEIFKKQTEESFIILNEQAQDLKPTKSRLNHFKISPIHTTDNTNAIKAESPLHNYEEAIELEANTIVKIEHETSDNEIPLSEFKKEKNKVTIEDSHEGRIRMIVFSEEEMVLDRERCRKMEAYLKLPFKCENCIVGFDYEMTLKGHMESRHRKNKKVNLLCNICKSVLGSELSYKEHMKGHYRRYECTACGKRAHDISSIESHYNNVHGDIGTRYACEECDFVTNTKRAYRYHKVKHKPKQQCQLCGNTFVTATGLRVHMCVVHKQSNRVFSCTICHKSYKGPSGLVGHMASSHSGVTAYCELCNKHFKSANNLANHLKTHSNHVVGQRYSCDDCGAKFRTKVTLVDHIEFVHLKVNKHQCTKCAKVFKSNRGLKKHMTYVHEKVRPPRNKICDQCGRGFTTLSILRSHIRTHTGERPLQCAQCPATFAHSGALYTHNKLLHNTTQR